MKPSGSAPARGEVQYVRRPAGGRRTAGPGGAGVTKRPHEEPDPGLDDTAVDLRFNEPESSGTDAEFDADESLYAADEPAPPSPARRTVFERAAAQPEPAPDPDADAYLAGTDPEAHVRNTRERRARIKRQILGAGGQFVLGLVIGLVALALVILALMVQTLQYIVPAAICAPPAFIYLGLKWRRWLGQAPYAYRLLTSLGEDADNLLAVHHQRKTAKLQRKLIKAQRRGQPID